MINEHELWLLSQLRTGASARGARAAELAREAERARHDERARVAGATRRRTAGANFWVRWNSGLLWGFGLRQLRVMRADRAW